MKNRKLQKIKSSKKAFTLVETLVAVSILMMSVTGPLFYASESLKAATYARDQITAFYLAQDAFEQIRKIRDDNVYGVRSWNYGLTGCETSLCRITNAGGQFYTIDLPTSNTDYYYLYKDPISGVYSHKTVGGEKTLFQRTVMITPTDGTQPSTPWVGATEMKVTVNIIWNSRGVDRNFQVYELFRNLK